MPIDPNAPLEPYESVNFQAFKDALLKRATLLSAVEINRVAVGVEQLTENQPDPDVVIDRLTVIASASDALASVAIRGFEDVSARMGQTVEAILAAGRQIDLVAVETARTAAAVEAIAGRIPDPRPLEVDYCTALLTATVDVSGDIVDRTRLGALLNAAGFQSIDKLKGKEQFIRAVRGLVDKEREALPEGLAVYLTEDVLGCYWDRAKALAKGLKPMQGGAQAGPATKK